LLNEELQNLYSSPNTIRHIKKRRIKWAEHVTRIEEERKLYKVWFESPKKKDHSEDQGVDGRLGSECMLGRLAGQDSNRWRALVNTVINFWVHAQRN
jgi:hypothetical protein